MSTTAEAFWDKAAEKYAKKDIKDKETYEATLNRVRHYLRPEHEVLELGCGSGMTSLLLADQVKSILATDLSSKMIGIGQKNAVDQGVKNVCFQQSGVFYAPPEGQTFDVIMAFNLLHLIEDMPGAIRHLANLTKPGGLMITKSACLSESFNLWKPAISFMRMLGVAPYVRFMKVTELEASFKDAGFALVERENYPAKPVNRFLVARKL